jgi:ABC-2 type transport system ATP-binding protein
VRAVLTAPAPDLTAIDGLSNVKVDGVKVDCDVTGSMQPLMAALVGAGIDHLTTEEPSLEEVFLAHYGDTPATGASSHR